MDKVFSELTISDDPAGVEGRYGQTLNDPIKVKLIGAEVEELAERFVDSQDEDVVPDMDFSDESLMRLDELLGELLDSIGVEDDEESEADLDTLEPVIIDMGSYLARVIHENLGGQWYFRHELLNTSLYFARLKLECFPYHQVMKRIALGPDESLSLFYEDLVERLCGD